MFCDFILLSRPLLQKKPSLLGAVAIYATLKISNKRPWNADLQKCTGGIQEEQLRPLANELFHHIKRLEQTSLKTLFLKYEQRQYLEAVKVIQKIMLQGQ